MNKKENSNYNQLGLIGRNISYSFSPDYFAQKFKALGFKNYKYQIFDLEEIKEVERLWEMPHLVGLNVTIPYKEAIIQFLDEISPEAKSIGAVNTIAFKNNKAIGYNTDYIGFLQSLKPLLQPSHQSALILGSGGANKAVQFALDQLNIPYHVVSRNIHHGDFTYDDLTHEIIQQHALIINTTPLGTHPHTEEMPNIPYKAISSNHLVYDLIYNPAQTKLLQVSKNQGAIIKNGLEMLALQADAAWEIWHNSPL